jgi:gliding motility-associated-like protein
MYQYDLQASNIVSSAVMIGQYNSRYMSALQLGPDGKIYMMNSASLNTLVAVQYPNNAGVAAGLQTGVLTVTDGDSIGLPTFNQTYFQSGIAYQSGCGNTVVFDLVRIPGITAVAWNFDDPNSGASNESGTGQHTFSAPGTYTVTATITSNNATQTATVQVEITGSIALTQPQNLVQCVPAGANTAVFNLTVQEAVILSGLNAEDYTVAYYPSETDAQSCTNAFLNPEAFSSGGEVIYVGVTNTQTGCTGTTAFGLVLTPAAVLPALPDLSLCGTNGTAQFDLTVQEQLLDDENFPVAYFTSEADAVANANAIPFAGAFENTQNPQTVYMRSGAGDCYAVGSFQLTVADMPSATITNLLEGCPPFNLAEAVDSGQMGIQFSYYTSEEDAALAQNVIANTVAYTFAGSQAVVYIRAENSQGCFDIEPVGLAVGDCNIPNGISPNGDDKNNEFDLTFMDISRLVVYNRYGLEVFSLNNYTNQWHGQDEEGHELPTGVYYYYAQPAHGMARTGWVYLNRESD